MAFHKNEVTGSIHIPHQWEYVDTNARTSATGFVSTDIGKLARQTDNNTLWMLTATTPTWKEVGGGSGDVVGPVSSTNNGIVLFDSTTGKLIKDSQKSITTTLGIDDTTVPTSLAVKTVTDGKQNSIGYTPENISNKSTDNTLGHDTTPSDVLYPTQKAVHDFWANGNPTNLIRISKNGLRDFDSIAEAVDSISDASETNRYGIIIEAGTYTEPEINLTEYIALIGREQGSVYIQPDGNHNVINMETNSFLSFCIIQNAPTGYIGINIPNVGNYITIHKVTVYNCDTGIKCHQTDSTDGQLYLEYVDVQQNGTQQRCYDFLAPTGTYLYVNNENGYVLGLDTDPYCGWHFEGAGCDAVMTTCSVIGFGSVDTGTFPIGIHILDGAKLKITNVDIEKMYTAIKNDNIGDPVYILANGITIEDCVEDVHIHQPNTSGYISGIASKSKSIIDSPYVSAFGYDREDNSIVATGKFYSGNILTDVTEMTELWNRGSTMGLMNGGILTKTVTPLQLKVSAGLGYRNTIDNNDLVKYEWEDSYITLDAYSNVYIYWNENNILTKNSTRPDTTTNILLGRVLCDGASIAIIFDTPMDALHTGNKVSDYLKKIFGPMFESGGIVTENTQTGNERKLDITSGIYRFGENTLSFDADTTITFDEYTYSGGYPSVSSTDTINNTQYVDGSSTYSLTSGYYNKHALYLTTNSFETKYFLFVGNLNVATEQLATEASSPPIYENINVNTMVHIADIIVQQGNDSIIGIIDERPRPSFAANVASSIVTDHGGLTGLGDDDHTQYLLVSGARSLSGNLNLGGNQITNVGNVDGVDVSTHASRHLPNGADALTTATPSDIGTTNTEGNANSFARSNHVHNHSDLSSAGGTHHSKAQVGLGNADNTSDLNKPISTATQTALNNKTSFDDAMIQALIFG